MNSDRIYAKSMTDIVDRAKQAHSDYRIKQRAWGADRCAALIPELIAEIERLRPQPCEMTHTEPFLMAAHEPRHITFLWAATDLPTANDRNNRHHHASLTKALRDAAAVQKMHQARLARFDRAAIDVLIEFPTNRRRDSPNWHPAAKAIVDGLVSGPSSRPRTAGPWPHSLLPDDNDNHLTRLDVRAAIDRGLARLRQARITITITPQEDQ